MTDETLYRKTGILLGSRLSFPPSDYWSGIFAAASPLAAPIWDYPSAGDLGTFDFGDAIDIPLHAHSADGSAVSYILTSGALPSGVALLDGTLFGTSENSDTFSFTISARNEGGNTLRAFTLTETSDAPTWTTASGSIGSFNVDVPLSFDFAATGSPTITYTLTSGALPDGTTLDSDGHLHGTPAVIDVFSFEITATNPIGATPRSFTAEIVVPGLNVIEIEDGSGSILLEDASGSIGLET